MAARMQSDALEDRIAALEERIEDLEADASDAGTEAANAEAEGNAEAVKYWRTVKQLLRNEELQLRETKLLIRDEKARIEILQQGVGLTLAAALPAGRELHKFWCQLAAVEQLIQVDSAHILQLGNDACFPLDEDEVRGRLIVRRCYDDLLQLLEHHFSCSGRSFIVTGNPGIGKSLFLYFLMWRLAHSGRTVIWDRQYVTPVMFSSQGVFKGPLEAFERQLQDPETWYLVDGKRSANRRAKTVLVTSLDYDAWKDANKRPDSILRQMPVWSWEEIQAARQHIFSSQNESDVADRYSRWGGIPRMVLQNLDAFDQGLLTTALNSCSLSELTSSMADLSSTTSKLSDMLLHQTVDAGYLEGPVVFASKWVEKEAISRHSQGGQYSLRDFLAGSGGVPSVAAFRVALWEHYAHAALQRGGRFSCRDLQNPEAGPFEIELEPCSSPKRLRDTQDISTGRSSGVYGWGESKDLAAVSAVQPARLLQITMSGDHSISARGIADAARAMQGRGQDVELFFVVPQDVFSRYTEQTLERIRGDLAAEGVARAVKQYVLRIDI